VELHEASAERARSLLEERGLAADVATADFFDVPPRPAYDAVVGNPPYVRYQDFAGHTRRKGVEAALGQGVRLSGLASSWAAFTVHAASFLKPSGRLGLVLPAELLSVNYAAEVRAFLLRRFATVRLIAFSDRVFPGVTEEVVLLLAEGTGPTDRIELVQVNDVSALGRQPPALSWTPSDPRDKWVPALLSASAATAYSELTRDGHFTSLATWGDPDLGMVTGNNRYFTLSQADVDLLGLRSDEVVRISPPGSRHLRGITYSASVWRKMARSGHRVYLFRPDVNTGNQSPGAQVYLKEGVRLGVPEAYKCRVRREWWRVPLVPVAHLFFTYMNHDAPRLVSNGAAVLHVNSIHGLRLKEGCEQLGMDFLPMASLNSVTLLGAELVGRSYGGGILKVEPKEADLLPVPSFRTVAGASAALTAIKPSVINAVRAGQLLEAVALVDAALLSDHAGVDTARLMQLRDARQAMFLRRSGRRRPAR